MTLLTAGHLPEFRMSFNFGIRKCDVITTLTYKYKCYSIINILNVLLGPDLGLEDAVTDGLLAEVGVQGGHDQVLAEGGDGAEEPLLPRLGVDADRILGGETEADEAGTERLHDLVGLIVVNPLVVAENQLFEHFSTFLLFVLFAKHLSRAQTFLIPVSSDRILPNFVNCVHIVLFDELNMSLFLLLNISRHTDVRVRLFPITFFVLLHLSSKKWNFYGPFTYLLRRLTLFYTAFVSTNKLEM